jgi:hypothetical protein
VRRKFVESRKKLTSIAFTGAAATLAVGMTATHALATGGTWSVKNGSTLYKGAVKGANKTGTVTKLVDTTPGHAVTLTCKKATASGNVSKSEYTSASPTIAKITKVTFTSCSFGGNDFHATAATNVVAKSYASGVTKGRLAGTTATISGSKNNSCHATVSQASSLPGSYHNASNLLAVDTTAHKAGLRIKSASSCGNLAAGNTAYFSGQFTITTPSNMIITDP